MKLAVWLEHLSNSSMPHACFGHGPANGQEPMKIDPDILWSKFAALTLCADHLVGEDMGRGGRLPVESCAIANSRRMAS